MKNQSTVPYSCTRWFLLGVLLLGLAGCGGGGDSGPSYYVNASSNAVNFAAERNTSPPAAQNVSASFNGDGLIVGYPPGVLPPSWLSVTAVGQSSPVSVRFEISSTALAAGTYTTTLRFVSGKVDGSVVVTQDVRVTYVMTDPLRVTPNALFFDATKGAAALPRQVQITGANIRWTTASTQPWLNTSTLSGVGATTISITADAASLSDGVNTAELRVTDLNTNLTRMVPIDFHVSKNRWNASRTGVSLIAFSDQVTPRAAQVLVTNDGQSSVSWTATVDVPWLTVTQNGVNGQYLTVQANSNAAALAANTQYIGTITLAGAGLEVEKVRAGYFRSSSPMPTETHFAAVSTSISPYLAIDPIRPVAYLGGYGSVVKQVNLLTGQVTSLQSPSADSSSIGGIEGVAISGDGRYLFGTAYGRGLTRWDLDSGVSTGSRLLFSGFCCGQKLILKRQRGVEVLLSEHFDIFNLSTGLRTALSDAVSTDSFWYIAGSKDGRDIYRYYLTGQEYCPTAQHFSLVTRPSSGDGYLTNMTEPPRYSSGSCITMRGFDTTHDSSRWYFLNQGSLVTSLRNGFVTPLLPAYGLRDMRVGHTDRKVLSYFQSPTFDNEGIVVLGQTDEIIATFSDPRSIEDVDLFAEDIFAAVAGSSDSALGGLHLYRVQ